MSTLLSESDFKRLADLALAAKTAEHMTVSISDAASATARIANNQIVQNVSTRRTQISVRVSTDKRSGSASTTDLDDDSIRAAVERAEAIAAVAPKDPEDLPPLPPQRYPILATWRPETAEATPARLLRDAQTAIRLCAESKLDAAGIVSASRSARGVAASSGLSAFQRETQAEFSLTATLHAGKPEASSGWVADSNRSIDDLRVEERTRVAIDKALRSADPRELPPGDYPVILEPAAVAGMLGPLTGALRARAYHRGTSALAGKLNRPIIDGRLTLRNRPDHPALLGDAFDMRGMPTDYQTWIDRGTLVRLDYDRFTAQERGVAPTYPLDAPHLSGESPAAESIDELIRTTRRAILVTNFWYIRGVNPIDLTMTGMTRDGTFLVEDGRIVSGLKNFRLHDSPLRLFNCVEAFTPPLDAQTAERGKMLLPAMRLSRCHFSSATTF